MAFPFLPTHNFKAISQLSGIITCMNIKYAVCHFDGYFITSKVLEVQTAAQRQLSMLQRSKTRPYCLLQYLEYGAICAIKDSMLCLRITIDNCIIIVLFYTLLLVSHSIIGDCFGELQLAGRVLNHVHTSVCYYFLCSCAMIL